MAERSAFGIVPKPPWPNARRSEKRPEPPAAHPNTPPHSTSPLRIPIITDQNITNANTLSATDPHRSSTASWWQQWRDDMPVTHRHAYFDHAAVGPLTGSGAAAIAAFAKEAAECGDVNWPSWNARLGRIRELAAQMIHADKASIALIPNTSTGIATVAEGLDWRSGDSVVLPDHEFPSNLFPWQNQRTRGVSVRTVPRRDGAVHVDDLLDACDASTRLISLSWVTYDVGFRMQLGRLVDAAHRRGILVFVDAIQGFGMYPLSIEETPVDFLAADGHKWLLGPEGFGVLMVRPQVRERLRPINVGWASVKNSFDYAHPQLVLRDDAVRFESGSGNMVAAAGLLPSLERFVDVQQTHGVDAIQQRVLGLAHEVTEKLRSTGAIVRRSDDPDHQSGIVNFTLRGIDPASIRTAAADAGVILSCRGGGVRAAVHVYNDSDDIDRLIDVVRHASRGS